MLYAAGAADGDGAAPGAANAAGSAASKVYPIYTSVHVSLGVGADLSRRPHVLHVPCRIDSGGGRGATEVGLKHYCYEPSFAPPGKSVVRAMLVADYDWWKALRTRADGRAAYDAEKERIGAEVAALVEAHYPEARGKIEVVDVATPTTYERYCNAWRGTWMAWANTPGAKIRGVPATLPGLTHFYQAGQWLLLPGGLPVAVVTGKWAIQHVCRAEKVRFRP